MENNIKSTNFLGIEGEECDKKALALIEKAEIEIAHGDLAATQNNQKKAALYYVSAYKVMNQIEEQLRTPKIQEGFARLYMRLSEYKDLGVEAIAGFNFKDGAIQIYRTLFDKYRSIYYRKKLEELGELEVDTLDYSISHYLINRPVKELGEMAVTLKEYDILENDDGDILIAMHTRVYGEEGQAILFCDGGEHVLLFKGPYRLVICDYVHPEIRHKLTKKEQILCCETSDASELQTEYLVEVVRFSGTSKLAKELMEFVNPKRYWVDDEETW